MIQIENDDLVVMISKKGAELQSIQLNALEYLWQANSNYWGKHAPVLFPIIGELKDGKYIFDEKEYHLPRHGFARDKEKARAFLRQPYENTFYFAGEYVAKNSSSTVDAALKSSGSNIERE